MGFQPLIFEKICTVCSIKKDITDFHKNKSFKDGYRYECKRCQNNQRNERRRNNKDKTRDEMLKYHYNISLIEYNKMLELQNGCCSICKKPETSKNRWNSKARLLCVDHDGKLETLTGEIKVRGLLCFSCNIVLGKVYDDINILQNCIDYLLKNMKLKKVGDM